MHASRRFPFRAALALVAFGLVALSAPARAESPAVEEALATCTRCHDESEPHPVLSILHTPHAVVADPASPFAQDGCASCHGPSEQHQRRGRGPRAAPDVVFRADGPTPIAAQNAACLACHQGDERLHWQGSAHDLGEVGCVGCHDAHAIEDPMLDTHTQTEACVACHSTQRAELLRPSSHPLLEGKMACSDCHAPHGSSGPALLTQPTLNETCYTCHAELRGPFLWEHAPVREDCSLCHRPHGSVHPALLLSRGPWLCQQCHDAQFHPSTAYSGTGLPGETLPSGAQSLLGKNCMNCHSHVHGSNHPSGAGLTR